MGNGGVTLLARCDSSLSTPDTLEKTMSIIAALLPNQDRLRRLQTAIRGRHQIALCSDWGALHRLCETQPISTAVFDLFATGEMGLEPVRQLRRLFPRLITVAYVSTGNHDRFRDIFD